MKEEAETKQGYRLVTNGARGQGAAYLSLPKHPRTQGCVSRTVSLRDMLPNSGPEINLDLDATGAVIGIEILD